MTSVASAWLDPIRRALDARAEPIRAFIRDDDGGWAHERLEQLARQCSTHGLPIDVAVIPAALTADDASRLLALKSTHRGRLGLHQHGWAHVSHEQTGRKCEFGPSRARHEVQRDLTEGQRVMTRWFGAEVDPIFTPPWNRCTDSTAMLLLDIGFEVLSRDVTAPRVDCAGLLECPVTNDWFAKRHGQRIDRNDWTRAFAVTCATQSVLGLLLHHAGMDQEEFERLDPLLRLLAEHPLCRPCSLLDTARSLPRQDVVMERLR